MIYCICDIVFVSIIILFPIYIHILIVFYLRNSNKTRHFIWNYEAKLKQNKTSRFSHFKKKQLKQQYVSLTCVRQVFIVHSLTPPPPPTFFTWCRSCTLINVIWSSEVISQDKLMSLVVNMPTGTPVYKPII